MNATDASGHLKPIPNCYLLIGNFLLEFNNLPDFSDSKSADYENTDIPGRASPITSYNKSGIRSISCSITLIVQDQSDCKKNLKKLRNIQSAVYPRRGDGAAPFYPPVLCKLKCGDLFSSAREGICCIIKDYNVKFPVDVPWDEETLCPYKMEVSMNLEQVFASSNLPGQDMILGDLPPGTP